MKSRKKYDAVATVGSYKDKTTGEEKKRYMNVGTVFESEDGRLSLKLETVPIGPGWSGYIQFFEPRSYQDAPAAARPVQRSLPPAPVADGQADDENDEIPF